MTSAQFFPFAAHWLASDDEANESMMQDVQSAIFNFQDGLPEGDNEDTDMVNELEKLIEDQTEEQMAVKQAKVQAFKDRVRENIKACLGQQQNLTDNIQAAIDSLSSDLHKL